MDNIRILLWLALLTMLWLGFNQWVEDYSVQVDTVAATDQPAIDRPAGQDGAGAASELPTSSAPAADLPAAAAVPAPGAAAAEPANPIRVRTDVLDVMIDPLGGDIVRVDLPTYPVAKDQPDLPVRLLDFDPQYTFRYRTGVRQLEANAGPTHLRGFQARANNYELAAGQDDLVVTLDWGDGAGLSARKNYVFRRGSYRVDLDIQVQNDTGSDWNAVPYGQIVRRNQVVEREYMNVDTYSFMGPVIYNGDSFEKLDTDDLADRPRNADYVGGWIAAIQHHFLAALVPTAGGAFEYQARVNGENWELTAIADTAAPVAAGAVSNFSFRLFAGPKLQDQLADTAPDLDLTVDYGALRFLSYPLFWLLDKIHGVVGNWGWAIILVTFVIKLAFYRLTATSGRSMAKMRKIAPRMKQLQERFKDDRQALSQAMMDLYKKEKVNPAAGCLPILIQMPFFFAFYWVLIESVEMRQAPFMLHIQDLSVRDPLFILPLLMAVAMFLQQRLSPAPPDPVQARVMQILPLVFCVMFAFFPAGLVLYWLTNTVLSIAQQWRINKLVAAES